jgi:glycosyltransferase involved in cell wall biosynthesis
MIRRRFTVVTAVLDDLAGLQLTWPSLAAQTCADWQWVVADGGSGKATSAWLSSLTDARVTWTSQPDRGVYDAMNRGLSTATGDLVVFLNAGDALAGAGVLALVDADQARRHWSWGYGATEVVDGEGTVVGVHRQHPFRRSWLEWGYRSVPHPSTYFTRALLVDLGGYDLAWPIAADQELIMRAAARAEPGMIGDTLATFRLGGASSKQAPDAFVRQARDIRRANHRMLAGRPWLDSAVTRTLAAEEQLRARLSRAAWRQAGAS